MQRLRKLSVAYSNVGDAALRAIAQVTGLEELNLDSCSNVRDQGAVPFAC